MLKKPHIKKIGKFILINSGFGKVIRASKTDWVEDAINAGKLILRIRLKTKNEQ